MAAKLIAALITVVQFEMEHYPNTNNIKVNI